MTHYILDTLDPKWERGVEIFASDYTQVIPANVTCVCAHTSTSSTVALATLPSSFATCDFLAIFYDSF